MRTPAWLIEAAATFNIEDKHWLQNTLIPIINKRNRIREEQWGKSPITATTYKNLMNYLKVYLFRTYSSSLLSEAFLKWIDSYSSPEQLNPYDQKLISLLKTMKSPTELLKLQVEMRAKLKRNRGLKTLIGKEFSQIDLLKPVMREIVNASSQKGKKKLVQRKDKTKQEN